MKKQTAIGVAAVVLVTTACQVGGAGDTMTIVSTTIAPTVSNPTTVPTATTVLATVPTATTVLATAPEVEATSSEVAIAIAFFDARNAYDVESATALFAPDAHGHEGDFITGVDMYPALFDWLRATGWQWTVDYCFMQSGDANTKCTYDVENAWIRALGLAPLQGTTAFEIGQGGIRRVPDFTVHHTGYFGNQGPPDEQLVKVWETVTDWVRANHPSDVGAMISADGSKPVLDARSIDLWSLYTQEFVGFQNP